MGEAALLDLLGGLELLGEGYFLLLKQNNLQTAPHQHLVGLERPDTNSNTDNDNTTYNDNNNNKNCNEDNTYSKKEPTRNAGPLEVQGRCSLHFGDSAVGAGDSTSNRFETRGAADTSFNSVQEEHTAAVVDRRRKHRRGRRSVASLERRWEKLEKKLSKKKADEETVRNTTKLKLEDFVRLSRALVRARPGQTSQP